MHKSIFSKESQGMLIILLSLFAVPTFAFSNYHLMSGIYYATIITQNVAIGLGLALFLGGLFKMKRYGEMRTMMSHQMTLSRPVAMMVAGVSLLCLPIFTKTLLLAFWGYSNPLAYPILSTAEATEVMKPIIAMVRLVGLFGVMRGVLLMSRAGGEQGQPGMIGKALMHILGGLLCLHILNTYAILKDLLEFNYI